VESIQFSGDGSLIATASADGTTRLWASEPGSEFPKLKLAGEQVQWVAFREPSSRQSFDLSNTATAAVRSTHSVDPKLADNPSSRSVNELVAVTNDGTVHNWSLPPLPLPAGSPNIASSSIAKTPLSSEGKGFGLLRWVGEAISFLGLRSQTKSLDWDGSSTRTKVASFSQESLNGLLTAPEEAAQPTSVVAPQHLQSTSEMTRSFAAELPKGTKLTGVAFSADTQLAATANSLGSIELWKLQSDGTVSLIRHLSPLHSADDSQAPTAQLNSSHRSVTIRQLAFSPEKQKLLGVGDDRMIYLWDVQSGKLIIRLKGHSAAIEQARFSPDGQLVVSASRDRTARLWSASTGELLNTLTHRNGVSSAQFSLDGQRIVTASLDGTARVLDAATGAIRVLLTGNRGALLDGEFSPDGQMLVTANADGTASLWDAQTGSEQALLRPAEVSREPIQRAFFSSDGRYVGMVSNTGKLYVWVTTWDGLLTLARDRSLRQLRPEECLRYLHLPPNACPTLDIKQEWERN
jgi:WD40 repeat protein